MSWLALVASRYLEGEMLQPFILLALWFFQALPLLVMVMLFGEPLWRNRSRLLKITSWSSQSVGSVGQYNWLENCLKPAPKTSSQHVRLRSNYPLFCINVPNY